MSTHKNIDLTCLLAGVLALALTVFCLFGTSSGLIVTANARGYENRLFDTERVHTIDIVMDDWDTFLDTCTDEEYSPCTVVIDGEKYANVGIRGKGNTSLSNVASMDSERYSFKLEFDQYEDGKSYYGLDKLCLNNLIQDNTYMKDYLAYRMMAEFGVDAPLCSFVYITVNGVDWGLYLAVEGIEDGFLQRSYGSDYGELYKPDSMSFGGGRGNGKDFRMDDFDFGDTEKYDGTGEVPEMPEGGAAARQEPDSGTGEGRRMPGRRSMTPPDRDSSEAPEMPSGSGNVPQMPAFGGELPDTGDKTPPDSDENMPEKPSGSGEAPEMPEDGEAPEMPDGGEKGGEKGGGMGSEDVKLQYIDDDADSYSNIFDNAKTDLTEADKSRLIASLKSLSSYENPESVLDTDEVLRYFVVHSYLVNGDSYTGSMIHNYYLYEKDGKLSMIPWDYNLAFGTFRGGSASASVNDAIDEVLSDRPMQAWIFSDDTYTAQYHALYAEFLETVDVQGMIDEAYALIAPYVEKDPTAFCTYEEFEAGVAALRQFCALRSESVRGQLAGTIPSTDDAQSADGSALIETGDLSLSDMGTMSGGGGMGGGRQGKADRPEEKGAAGA